MAGGISDNKGAARGGEIAIGDVDGDALFTFGLEAVGEEGEINIVVEIAFTGGAFDGGDMIFVDVLRIMQEAADEG